MTEKFSEHINHSQQVKRKATLAKINRAFHQLNHWEGVTLKELKMWQKIERLIEQL